MDSVWEASWNFLEYLGGVPSSRNSPKSLPVAQRRRCTQPAPGQAAPAIWCGMVRFQSPKIWLLQWGRNPQVAISTGSGAVFNTMGGTNWDLKTTWHGSVTWPLQEEKSTSTIGARGRIDIKSCIPCCRVTARPFISRVFAMLLKGGRHRSHTRHWSPNVWATVRARDSPMTKEWYPEGLSG